MNEEPKVPLTKLSVRNSKENPIQLYQIDLVRTEKGKRINTHIDRTKTFEWWMQPDDRCWMVPDGNYLVVQGSDLWLVNVADREVTWNDLKGLTQDVKATWSKLVITDKPIVEAPKESGSAQVVIEDLVREKSDSDKKAKKR
jgi:hypothetical protein